MLRLVGKMILAPFWVLWGCAIGSVALTEMAATQDAQLRRDQLAALSQPMPRPVDLSAFRRDTDLGVMDEVHVTGWFHTEHNTRLTHSKNGKEQDARYMLVMFGAQDDPSSTVARAALLLTEAQKGRFGEDILNYVDGAGRNGPIFRFNGRGSTTAPFSDVAMVAFERQNITRSDDFIFVSPYFQGRTHALAPGPDHSFNIRLLGYGFALVLFLIGLIRRRRSKRAGQGRSRQSDGFASGPIKDQRPVSVAPDMVPLDQSRHNVDPFAVASSQPVFQTIDAPRGDGETAGRAQSAFQQLGQASHAGSGRDRTAAPQHPAMPAPDPTQRRGRARLPMGLINLVVLVVLLSFLPGEAFYYGIMLLVLGTVVSLAKEVLALIGRGIKSALFHLLGRSHPTPPSDPFDRLAQSR